MNEQRNRVTWYVLRHLWPGVLLLLVVWFSFWLWGWLSSPLATLLLVVVSFASTASLTIRATHHLLHNFSRQIHPQQIEETVAALQQDASFPLSELAPKIKTLVEQLVQEQTSRVYFDSIFQSMINTFMVVGANGRIQEMNPATCELLGYNERELIGRPLGNILNARTFPLQDIGLVELLANEPLRNIEAVYIARDGREIPIIFSSSAIRNMANEVLGIVCVAQDITGLKRTERALAEREKQFRLLFDEAPIGMAIVDPSKRFRRVNQAFCELVHYSRRELVGEPITAVIHPQDLIQTVKAIDNLIAGHASTFGQETRYINQAGNTVPIWLQGAILLDNRNQPSQLIIQTVNITKQKQAELERVQMTNLLRKAANISEHVTGILEPLQLLKTAVSFLQQHFNLYHVHLFLLDEYSQELVMLAGSGDMGELLVLEAFSIPLHHEKSIVAWAARTQESVMVNNVHSAPYYLPNKWLPKTAAEVAIPLIARDKLVGVLDIQDSQRNRFRQSDVDILNTVARQIAISLDNARLFENIQANEERLRHMNIELAQSAKAKDEFLASMSHELRTPLTGILGKAEVLAEGIYGHLNDMQARAVSRIEQSGQQLLNLINDMLDIAKIEAGRLQLDKKRLDVRAVCEYSLHSIRAAAAHKNQTVTLQIAEEATTIYADERRLRQILENLLSNAVKFTPDYGNIGLEVVCQTREISFTIWDSGIGIEKARLRELFQLFQQIDGSLSRHHEGAGLGLALAYRLVQLHAGHISIDSELGQGSRFTVSLPLYVESFAQQGESIMSTLNSAQSTTGVRERPLILLVEDSKPIVETISIYLPRRGYDLIVAKDGQTGVDEATTQLPDLILMDIQLPQLDGIEAIRRIRRHPQLTETPIIVLTGLDLQQEQAASMEAGANEFLRKPFKLNTLNTVLEQFLPKES